MHGFIETRNEVAQSNPDRRLAREGGSARASGHGAIMTQQDAQIIENSSDSIKVLHYDEMPLQQWC